MKLAKLTTLTLPLLGIASALPGGYDGGYSDEYGGGKMEQGHPEGMANAGDWSSEQGPNPAEWSGRESGDRNSFLPSNQKNPHLQRDIATRSDYDFHIEECNSNSPKQVCQTRIAVPKGKDVGPCLDSIYDSFDKYITPKEAQLMCTYYKERGCKGQKGGPWTNKETHYSLNTYLILHFPFSTPMSYQCELVTFDKGPAKSPGCYALANGDCNS